MFLAERSQRELAAQQIQNRLSSILNVLDTHMPQLQAVTVYLLTGNMQHLQHPRSCHCNASAAHMQPPQQAARMKSYTNPFHPIKTAEGTLATEWMAAQIMQVNSSRIIDITH